MWVFWIVIGLVAAAAAALVIARAGAVARRTRIGAEDPSLAVHRRQLAELAEQARQGLLSPDEHRAARTEAGRRLLRTADTGRMPEHVGGRTSRLASAFAALVAAMLALAGYLTIGSPGLGDQPYAARLDGWRRGDPASLDPPRMAAILREIAKSRPHDPQVYDYLGRAELAAGDGFNASRAFETAAALAPQRASLRAAEGEALVLDAGGKVTPQASAAFLRALKLDPGNAPSRYYLARAQIAGGDAAAGLAEWRKLEADMPTDDPRRQALHTEIARAEGGAAPEASSAGASGPLAGGPTASPLAGPQAAFIQAMVARQAAALQAHPDDAAGWARLVRSYGVLSDLTGQQRALAEARRVFAKRPGDLAPIEAQARGGPAG